MYVCAYVRMYVYNIVFCATNGGASIFKHRFAYFVDVFVLISLLLECVRSIRNLRESLDFTVL